MLHFQRYCYNTNAIEHKSDNCFKIRLLLDKVNEYFQNVGIFPENKYFHRWNDCEVLWSTLTKTVHKAIRSDCKLWGICRDDGY